MFIGNQKAIDLLQRLDPNYPHILLTGPSGHGKSTLAKKIGENKHFIQINANAIQDNNDLYACLKQIQEHSFLFIDEIHSLKTKIQESLYEAMESFIFQRINGRGSNKSFESISLQNFTLIGATDRENKLNTPLKNRFLIIRLQPYSYHELVRLAINNGCPNDIASVLAHHCRGTPRTLINLCKLYLQTKTTIRELLALLDIYPLGLTKTEVDILTILTTGPKSLNSIAAKLSLPEDVIQEEHETYLIQNTLIERNKIGREITNRGQEYLRRVFPQPNILTA